MMTLDVEVVRENWAIVQERIRLASVRGGWDHKVNVVAATKYVDLDDMDILIQAGIKVVGENRAEELEGKWRRFRDALDFQFIGHLQSRKARRVVPRVSLIHSVDSLSLVEQIDKRTDVDVDVLLQVNVSGEESKYGILPGDAEAFLERAAPYETVRFVGLMTMAPLAEDAEETRPVFRGLRALRDDLASRFSSRYALKELSMGMSNDYQVAVEEVEQSYKERPNVKRIDRGGKTGRRRPSSTDFDDIFAGEEDRGSGGNKAIRPVPSPSQKPSVEVHLIVPKSFNDAQLVADKFKKDVPVIINLQSSEKELSKRLIDFTSGLTYALEGGMQRVADRVFLLTPNSVEVSAEQKQELMEKGFFNQY